MAESKPEPKRTPASNSAALPEISPQELKEVAASIESLPEDEQAVAIGLLAMNPEAAQRARAKHKEYKTKAECFDAWAQRQSIELQEGKKHKPVAALFVGKAVVVRTRVSPKTKHMICKPDIFGVFASREASGVLTDHEHYKVAVACARGAGRSTSSNVASNKLTNPLKLLKQKALVDLKGQRVLLMPGCEAVFDRIEWPPPVKRPTYVDPEIS